MAYSEVQQHDVLDLIVMDHNKIRDLWREFQHPQVATTEQKQKLAWSIEREVSMHASKEEETIYPAVRKMMGDKAADHMLQEHAALKKLLAKLDGMKIADSEAEFMAVLNDAMSELFQHMKSEEQDFLPKFRSMPGVTQEYLLKLGHDFTQAGKHAVTRPHPHAPDQPPMNKIANMAAAPLDALADQVRFGGNPPN